MKKKFNKKTTGKFKYLRPISDVPGKNRTVRMRSNESGKKYQKRSKKYQKSCKYQKTANTKKAVNTKKRQTPKKQ